MTLREMSDQYQAHADAIAQRMEELRCAAHAAEDPEQKSRLEWRIHALRPMLLEARELMVLTRFYYDRGYHKNGKYTL